MKHALLWRALFAFLVLPGTVAFLVPWLLVPDSAAFHAIGLAPLAVGITLLLWCVRDFYVAGRGTLAPWSPPKTLVVVGLYRLSRNPMYVAVLLIIVGWAVSYQSFGIAVYGVIIAIGFHVRVVVHEEPFLATHHGPAWTNYRGRVPRWIGRPR